MKTENTTTRREFLGGVAALGALGLTGHPGFAWGQESARKGSRPASKLPARGEFVIRNAYVMTMDSATGDLPGADVQVIDGRGMIVLPGFVETHWHMWNTLLRSMSGDKREHGYFPTAASLGKEFAPEDMYQGTRLAAAEALNGGITFVHDWCHNIRGAEYAEADLRALRETGIRGRFSYGAPQAPPATETIDLANLELLHRDWK